MKSPLNENIVSEFKNENRFWTFFYMLKNIALSNIQWEGLPEEIDTRYVENSFFENGHCLFFWDEIFLFLNYMPQQSYDVYNNPIEFVVQTPSGYYNTDLTIKNAVPVYANMTRTPEVQTLVYYADELTRYAKYMDINMDNCSTSAILTGPQDMELSIKNALQRKKLGVPVTVARKDFEEVEWKLFGLEAQKHFISDKLVMLFEKKWNECLTWLGVPNLQVQKKERLLSDEVSRSQGGTIASRNSRLEARRQGAEAINRMFGLNVSVKFRDSFLESESPLSIGESEEENESLYDRT